MESFKQFAGIFISLILVVYGMFFIVDPNRYLPGIHPLTALGIGALMIAAGLWVYMRDKDGE